MKSQKQSKNRWLQTIIGTAVVCFLSLLLIDKSYTVVQLYLDSFRRSSQQTSSLAIIQNSPESKFTAQEIHIQEQQQLQQQSPLSSSSSSLTRAAAESPSSSAHEKPVPTKEEVLPRTKADSSVHQPDKRGSAETGSKSSLNRYGSNNMPEKTEMSWDQFIALPRPKFSRNVQTKPGPLNDQFVPVALCSKDIEKALDSPVASQSEVDWCKWALSDSGGKVKVGKSWGELARKKEDKEKFDELNCNAVSKGKTPRCTDAWGDVQLIEWIKNKVSSISCDPQLSSKIECHDNDNGDRYCTFENAQINFGMMRDKDRGPQATKSRTFDKGFFSIDCEPQTSAAPGDYIKFSHLYSPKLQNNRCDYVINGTTLLYSHDDIRNLGHTMNDIMNVWTIMWLNGIARDALVTTFLNVDSFNLGHNFDDDPNASPFYVTYKKNFQTMLKGSAFGSSTVCMQRVLMQSSPPKFYVWDSWFKDNVCTFRGPSVLFQRYNLAVRHSFGLLGSQGSQLPTDKRINVVMILRKQTHNMWGDAQTSRNTLNQAEVESHLHAALNQSSYKSIVRLRTVSFEGTTFEKQMKVAAGSSIIIGMHGAGIAVSLNMPIGTKYCCGVIEIFPKGPYTPIRGYGNMIRRAGLKYDRVDIRQEHSTSVGATIPPKELADKLLQMIDAISTQPTCIIQAAYSDPYFESSISP